MPKSPLVFGAAALGALVLVTGCYGLFEYLRYGAAPEISLCTLTEAVQLRPSSCDGFGSMSAGLNGAIGFVLHAPAWLTLPALGLALLGLGTAFAGES